MPIRKLELISLCCLIVSLAFSWTTIFEVGELVVRPVIPAIVVFLVLGIFSGDLIRGISQLLDCRVVRFFFAAFTIYLASQLVGSIAHSIPSGSLPSIAKGFIYLGIAFLVASSLVCKLDRDEFPVWVGIGAVVGTITFAVTFATIFAFNGQNILTSYIADIKSGNAKSLQFKYYSVLFDFGGEDANASFRNTFVTCFVVYFSLVAAVVHRFRDPFRLAAFYMSGTISVLLVLTSMSRINILALLFVIFFGVLAYLVSGLKTLRNTIAVGLILAVGCLGGGIILTMANENISSLVTSRFGSDLATDGRLSMFQAVLFQNSDDWIWGQGFGASIEREKADRVHNFILGSYFENGIVGLLPAILLFFALLAIFIGSLSTVLKLRSPVVGLKPCWIVGLAMVVILRMNLAGALGQVAIVDWIGFTFFVALTVHLKSLRTNTRLSSEF
jgi:O-antigen ligase